MILDDIFSEAMDELIARNPHPDQLIDVIWDILDNYDTTQDEARELATQLVEHF